MSLLLFWNGAGGSPVYTETHTFSGVGTASLQREIRLGKSQSAVGSQALARQASFYRSLAYSGVGTAALSKGKLFSQAYAFSATGTPALAKANRFVKAYSYAATGAAVLSKIGQFAESNAFSATGTLALVRGIAKGLAFSAAGTAGTVKQAGLQKAFSATGTPTYEDTYSVARTFSFAALGSLLFELQATFGGVATRVKRTIALLYGSVNRYLARKD